MAKATIEVIEGDITTQQVQGILTLANPLGKWVGGVDYALKNRFGDGFHSQLHTHWEKGGFRKSGETLIVAGKPSQPSVVFVCDDLNNLKPLSELLTRALELSFMSGIKSLALPVVRTGPVFYQLIENFDPMSAERDLIKVLKAFEHPMQIKVVVYNDPQQAAHLRQLLAK